MSPSDARALTESIRTSVDRVWDLITKAYTQRAWAVLGYPSWDVYCEREFASTWFRLPRETRTEVVMSLRDSGLSTRAIAAATGVSQSTVQRELPAPPTESNDSVAPSITGTNGKTYQPTQPVRPAPTVVPDLPNEPPAAAAPAPPPAQAATGAPTVSEVSASPAAAASETVESFTKCVCGSTMTLYAGATYEDRLALQDWHDEHQDCAAPAPAPVAEPAPRRRPITDSFADATTAMTKAVKRIEALAADDRFDKNADQIAIYVSDLIRARDALQRVIEKFPS
ncbi:winged helix-turn-helix domain-containing protein [Mycobacteroides abscessus]|uniref:winged helix-turn-helix domain-containing protein n=1 Tax=Mycobacteroides abscessus TaxID=36809 RepID=UPI0013F4F51D|nr:winged helix-turn-helix domain-containing protein [Mycobacteroides abscessus]